MKITFGDIRLTVKFLGICREHYNGYLKYSHGFNRGSSHQIFVKFLIVGVMTVRNPNRESKYHGFIN